MRQLNRVLEMISVRVSVVASAIRQADGAGRVRRGRQRGTRRFLLDECSFLVVLSQTIMIVRTQSPRIYRWMVYGYYRRELSSLGVNESTCYVN